MLRSMRSIRHLLDLFRRRRAVPFTFVFAATSFGTVGCENPVDVTPNAFDATREAGAADVAGGAVDAAGATGGSPGEAGTPGPCGCLAVGQIYRFDSLVLTALDGGPHPAVPQLNTRWAKDMAAAELDVFFVVTAIEGDAVSIRAVNGAEITGGAPGAQCELPETSVDFHLQRAGCTLTMTETAAINIYAGTDEIPKNCAPSLPVPHTIPVQQVRLRFDVAPACEGLTNGLVLEAGIPQSALRTVCTCLGNDAASCVGAATTPNCGDCPGQYANLEALIKAVSGGREPNYGCRTSTGEPAICLEATFTAPRYDAAPPICAGHGDAP
jgi:hypothetical protein